jgi:hypothetical protein
MQIVHTWIQKLFPDENFEDADQNILLQTIRVPKNLMFLTDKLPKSCYNEEENKRNTSDLSKIGRSETKLKQLSIKRMNKIEEADEEKEKEKKPKRKINVKKVITNEPLPDIQIIKKEEAPVNSSVNLVQIKKKKPYQPRNVSMDHIKDKSEEDGPINIKSISPTIANILRRKYFSDIGRSRF